MATNVDSNFIRYVVTTLVKTNTFAKQQGGKWVVSGLPAIPGLNQAEEYNSPEQLAERLINALQSQYTSAAGSQRSV